MASRGHLGDKVGLGGLHPRTQFRKCRYVAGGWKGALWVATFCVSLLDYRRVRHVGRHALILLQSFLYALQAFYDFLQLRVHLPSSRASTKNKARDWR